MEVLRKRRQLKQELLKRGKRSAERLMGAEEVIEAGEVLLDELEREVEMLKYYCRKHQSYSIYVNIIVCRHLCLFVFVTIFFCGLFLYILK